jgi:hypothetical protein
VVDLTGTVGWVLPDATLGIDKPEEFAVSDACFVSGFCIFFNDKQRPLDPRGAQAFVLSLGGRYSAKYYPCGRQRWEIGKRV